MSPPTAFDPTRLDWNLLRLFLTAAREGSLARAAQYLGSSQPTLSRQLAALEAQLGVALFERTRRGLRLTTAGQALREPVEQMHRAALEATTRATQRDENLAGTVRLTASEVASTFLLPPVLVALRRAHPHIQIELVASDGVENLLERAADIALRMVRPTEPSLIARKLAEWPLGLYASADYLALRGEPSLENAAAHDWVGMDRSPLILEGFRQATGQPVQREFFGWRCDHQVAYWMAVRAGAGVGIGNALVAVQCPEVRQVLPHIPLPSLPVWLTCHRELHAQPRLRVVFDALARAFGPAEAPAKTQP